MELYYYALILVLLGCGAEPPVSATKEDQTESCQPKKNKCLNKKDESTSGSRLTDEYITIKTYISPLNVTVNGEPYSDIEDYFTKEQERLNKEYSESLINLDGDLGIKDFSRGFYAILAAADTGVVREASLNNGSFLFNIQPQANIQARYTITASKRISVHVFTDQGSTPLVYCFNLTASKDISLEKTEVVLSDFETIRTLYQCANPSKSGIVLPAKQTKDTQDQPETAPSNEQEVLAHAS